MPAKSVPAVTKRQILGSILRISLIPMFLLALPLIEIAGFVVVGREIGVLPTIGLIIATGIAGSMLLRFQGFGVISRISQEIAAGRNPSRELAHGVMILLAGILLLIPGFFTDIIGVLLFVPPIRDLAWRFLKGRVNFSTSVSSMGGRFARPGRSRDKTIDLDQSDYSKDGQGSPWRGIDED